MSSFLSSPDPFVGYPPVFKSFEGASLMPPQLCPSCEGHVWAELLTPHAPEELVLEMWDKPGICEEWGPALQPLQGSVHLGSQQLSPCSALAVSHGHNCFSFWLPCFAQKWALSHFFSRRQVPSSSFVVLFFTPGSLVTDSFHLQGKKRSPHACYPDSRTAGGAFRPSLVYANYASVLSQLGHLALCTFQSLCLVPFAASLPLLDRGPTALAVTTVSSHLELKHASYCSRLVWVPPRDCDFFFLRAEIALLFYLH